MQRKPFKIATRRLRNPRRCADDTRFVFSSVSDVVFDSAARTTAEKPVLYSDLEKPSSCGEYGNFILQNLDTEKESDGIQIWKNSEDLLQIKLQAGQHWPGSVKLHCIFEELLKIEPDPEVMPITRPTTVQTFHTDVATETRSTTPDSLIWLSFPKDNTTRLLLKVVKKLEMYIEAGVLEECTDSVDSLLDTSADPPLTRKRKVRSLPTLRAYQKCAIS
ncbi:hypothetical protein ILUMI_06721 [Ignelater luminosus]|uniref:Uncharacterized protein n=1 Tax=Ignelater luminosus TaxID=2038154 RepID=A0A8K0D9D8_IGNLU|nr:hypothetical protein ILUMI_06721 [Ignelater luminosus]